MSNYKLIEIKIDEHGNKIGALIQKNKEKQWYGCQAVIDFINAGGVVDCAAANNNDLYLIPSNAFSSMINTQIKEWYIQEYLGNKKFMCVCSCGTIRAVSKYSLISGESKSCGHKSNAFVDLTDTYINEWHVLKYIGDSMWKCQCSCDKIRAIDSSSLRRNISKSCGHNTNAFVDLRKEPYNGQFGEWTAQEYLGGHKWKCQCSCGKIKDIYSQALRRGTTTSCGNCNRTDLQIELTSTKEKFTSFIMRLSIKLNHKPTISELATALGLTTSQTSRIIHKYEVEDYINSNYNRSNFEKDIADYIQSLKVQVVTNDRTILQNKELDIYIPNKNIAIEANGSYWHCSLYKDKNYHINKVEQCESKGIHLLHIFEHDWLDLNMQEKLKALIRCKLNYSQTIIYARQTVIKQIDNKQKTEFLNKYHLQNDVSCQVALGLYYDDMLIEVMTFGKPRFTDDYDYELLRLCTKHDYKVIGGASKLFKHFIKNNPTNSIISYCNHARFSGKVYTQIGMTYNGHTTPNYEYVHNTTLNTLSRQQCMKHKLLVQGFGTPDMTEEQIMFERGYLKVYDCGNKRFVYRPTMQ